MRHVRVAIIGAGTSGLSARREVAAVTDNYVVIDDGPLGTTCARVGCMPSKVLIQVANDFDRRRAFDREGIRGGEGLTVDRVAVMKHVRSLRDRFVRGVLGGGEEWADKLIRRRARFEDLHTLDLGDEKIRAERIIIATGSKPVIPEAWQPARDRIIDTDAFFELEELPERVVVIGLGVIGLELGQALARIGVAVVGVTRRKAYGGLTDPEIREYAHRAFSREFEIHVDPVEALSESDGQLVVTLASGHTVMADAALFAAGREPNLASLGIHALGVKTADGVPEFSRTTFRVPNTPWYIAGDVNRRLPLLHEAADEGRIAGYNAVRVDDECFQKRTGLAITFSEPNIAQVGETYQDLVARGADFVTGSVSYEGQGRAIVKLKELGLLHVYANRSDGLLLGAELLAPDGEHLAHLISWAIAGGMTVHRTLSLPFYHPVLEEGLRTALRDAARKSDVHPQALETLRCADPPVGVLA